MASPQDPIQATNASAADDTDHSDDSFDVYSEDESSPEQTQDQPGTAGDVDEAGSLESSAEQSESEAENEPQLQPDVADSSELVNSSSDSPKNQSPATAVQSTDPPSSSALPSAGSVPPPGPGAPAGPLELDIPAHAASPKTAAVDDCSPLTSAIPGLPPLVHPAAAADQTASHVPVSAEPDAPSAAAPSADAASSNEIDLEKLVETISARAAESASSSAREDPSGSQQHPAALNPSPAVLSSLPPKPLASQMPSLQAPAHPPREISSLPERPPSPLQTLKSPSLPSNVYARHTQDAGAFVAGTTVTQPNQQQTWEEYEADEKKYMADGRWDKFPDGSRIFVGNLSNERVKKHQVFELFGKFGPLAQISLKNAYGFVQYHTAAAAEAAMRNVQDAELGGRKIHLEHTRAQGKKKEDRQPREREPREREPRERDRSPARRGQRGRRGSNDRSDNRDQGRKRDAYRPDRSPPRGGFETQGGRREPNSYGREWEAPNDRRRSRSPQRRDSRPGSAGPGYGGRYDNDLYRHRRSPSPPRHTRGPEADGLDIPRRYGSDVPDVQLLLLDEVHRDFIGWIQQAFHQRGLRTDVMFLHPRFPRDAVLQRQVIEGVQGVVELDRNAQYSNTISIRIFSRADGPTTRFELYENIDAHVAAELVIRERQKTIAPAGYPSGPYAQQYQPPPPAQHYQAQAYYQPQPQPSQPPAPTHDLGGVLGNLDNASLQAVLASLQTSATPGQPPSQVDVHAVLNSLKHINGTGIPTGPVSNAPNYSPHPQGYPHGAGGSMMSPTTNAPPMGMGGAGDADAARQVQQIMNSLQNFRR